MMKTPFETNTVRFIRFVVLYRSIYGIAGGYLMAMLAPNRPLLHALIGGGIGVILSTLGTIAMRDIPPHWYPISLIILALPTAWLGGRLFE